MREKVQHLSFFGFSILFRKGGNLFPFRVSVLFRKWAISSFPFLFLILFYFILFLHLSQMKPSAFVPQPEIVRSAGTFVFFGQKKTSKGKD
jgi:hypothetical protein